MDKVAAFCMDEDSITALILAVLGLIPAGFGTSAKPFL